LPIPRGDHQAFIFVAEKYSEKMDNARQKLGKALNQFAILYGDRMP
jgi:hypothetical protein